MTSKKLALNDRATALIASFANEFPTIGDLTKAICGKSPKIRNKMILLLSESFGIPKGLLQCINYGRDVSLGMTFNGGAGFICNPDGIITIYMPDDVCKTVKAKAGTVAGVTQVLEMFKIVALHNLNRKVNEARMVIDALENMTWRT